MQPCSVLLKDAKLLRGDEICLLKHHGAVWHPSTPRSIVAFFNTKEQRDILQQYGTAFYASTPRRSIVSFNTTEHRCILQLLVMKDATLLRGVGGCHADPWC
jgi:hypothetical protein